MASTYKADSMGEIGSDMENGFENGFDISLFPAWMRRSQPGES